MNPFLNATGVSDEQLMEKYQQGEYMAFEALYYRHKDTVFTYLAKRLTDNSAREEVFQNIFLKFHKSKANYDSKYTFLQWIYTISRSELYDFYKKKKLSTVTFDEQVYVQEQTSAESIELDQIKTLSDKERRAIELRYYSDKDYDEISDLIGTSQSNARKLVSRGLKKIKLKLVGGQNE